jgi:hypothetical protein
LDDKGGDPIMKVSTENGSDGLDLEYRKLKKHAEDVLSKALDLLRKERYEEFIDGEILAHSPAGDSYGHSNYFINFAFGESELNLYGENDRDIRDIVQELQYLKNMITNEEEGKSP